ncbi:flavodoxin [Clostridium sp. chh4-2]|uniref:flavodoxin n=1 Tax=Clostridium sp. chh4-2 TaxID=2067550 RepID=UPI000CCE327C|nr:flavodoxin [Clostridium sp. chh4-2]PNV61240.1 flavodoxin [Clostridium sp. chh4-2]
MKKILSFIWACSMVFAVTACGSQDSVPAPGTTASASSQETVNEVQQTESLQSGSGENASVMEETGKEAGSDILVAYFSATGTTKTLAGYISEVTGGDLYEIVPEIPYSSEDLNYSDNNSRSTREQNDEDARPVISGSVEDMDQYGTIFLGYPIWWGEAPRIIDTFMESYDFSGKTIVPFCTSGGSGIGSSARNLHDLAASDVTWLDGERLSSGISHEEMVSWIDGLSLDVMAR